MRLLLLLLSFLLLLLLLLLNFKPLQFFERKKNV